jgi:Ca2+-binding RTX toxin-like protein
LLAANELLIGDAGDDGIEGGLGNDTIWGDSNFTSGHGGNDTVRGGEGNDLLYGDGAGGSIAGQDSLFGDAGADTSTAMDLTMVTPTPTPTTAMTPSPAASGTRYSARMATTSSTPSSVAPKTPCGAEAAMTPVSSTPSTNATTYPDVHDPWLRGVEFPPPSITVKVCYACRTRLPQDITSFIIAGTGTSLSSGEAEREVT